MTYQTEIEKIQQPLSAELYKLLIGSTYSYFTSYGSDIIYGGNTYVTRPMKRTGFSVEKSMKTIDVTISTPIAVAFQEYLSISPYARTYVEIIKVFVSSPDTLSKLIFAGMVYTVSVKKGIASVLCKSSNGLLSRKIPRLIYQTTCNWSLFSTNCGLSRTNFELIAVVGSVSGNDLVIGALSDVPDKKYQGGTITWGAEQRLVTGHSGLTLTLLVNFAGVTAGDQIFLYPGCNGSPTACASLGNELNFMGMPHIPTKNALLWGFR